MIVSGMIWMGACIGNIGMPFIHLPHLLAEPLLIL
jgi:hypothetical protein